MPRPEPVTIATFPSSKPAIVSSLLDVPVGCGRRGSDRAGTAIKCADSPGEVKVGAGAGHVLLTQSGAAPRRERRHRGVLHKSSVDQYFLTFATASDFWVDLALVEAYYGAGFDMRWQRRWVAAAAAVFGFCVASAASAAAPPQRLPSALLIYPLVVSDGVTDTRIEIVNLSRHDVFLSCNYVPSTTCSAFDFRVLLTPNQPLSWRASTGLFTTSATAVPPFSGTGELKCVVQTEREERDLHNAIQGRAAVFGADGQTIGYSAVGFIRLVDGPLTDVIDLDGQTYTQCPDEQHFAIVASASGDDPAAESEIVLAPCSEDFANLNPTTTTVQFLVYNEFEQVLSASTSVRCYLRRPLEDISNAFTRDVLGTDTGHLVVRAVQSPVLALLVDRFRTSANVPVTAGNEPAFRGGRTAQIRFP
jgi:hypothetical protein